MKVWPESHARYSIEVAEIEKVQMNFTPAASSRDSRIVRDHLSSSRMVIIEPMDQDPKNSTAANQTGTRNQMRARHQIKIMTVARNADEEGG